MFVPHVMRQVAVFAAAMVAGVAVVHGIIVAQGQRITPISQLALGVVAIGYLVFFVTHYLELRRVRFALLGAHAVGYLIVNGSFWLHASYLWASGQGDRVDSAWFGTLFGMSICWGLGLAIHAWRSAQGGGFEDAAVA